MTLAARTPPPPGEAGLYALAGRPQGLRQLMIPGGRVPAGEAGPMHVHQGDEAPRAPGTSARQSRTSLPGPLRLAGVMPAQIRRSALNGWAPAANASSPWREASVVRRDYHVRLVPAISGPWLPGGAAGRAA